jgi:hypothetical protein
MKIPKRFKGHAANQLRALLKHYKPVTKIEVMERVYDRTEDGPEIDTIKFFRAHPRGSKRGIARCLHIREGVCISL